jgi:hypothetical protein
MCLVGNARPPQTAVSKRTMTAVVVTVLVAVPAALVVVGFGSWLLEKAKREKLRRQYEARGREYQAGRRDR